MAPQEDVENGDDAQTQGRAGLAGTVEMIDGPEVPVVRDVPTRQTAPNHCLAKNPDAANRGATARTDAFDEPFVTAEADAVAASSADAPYVNLTRCFRNERTCP